MSFYLHDGAHEFRIVVRDELEGEGVQQLENAWTTAQSVLNGKQLQVDVSRVGRCDEAGEALLKRMAEAGAAVTVDGMPEPGTRGRLVSWWKTTRRTGELGSSGLDCWARR